MLDLVIYPDRRLKKKSQDVASFDDALKKFVDQMNEVLLAQDGSGLAAVQVGKNIRLFIVAQKKEKKYVTFGKNKTYASILRKASNIQL